MYAGYFGLQQTPFSIAPDPRYLLMSERHREALAHLLYGVQGGGGFVLLTGEIGAGKTTVCRCFLEQLPENCRVAYIFNPKLTVSDLLKTICSEFHIEVKHEGIGPATIKDHLDPLNAYLLASHARGERNVLIIDEAQNLTPKQMKTLITRGLVEESGLEHETGAILYKTTSYFLERLGLNSLEDLPALAPYLPDLDRLDEVLQSLTD